MTLLAYTYVALVRAGPRGWQGVATASYAPGTPTCCARATNDLHTAGVKFDRVRGLAESQAQKNFTGLMPNHTQLHFTK